MISTRILFTLTLILFSVLLSSFTFLYAEETKSKINLNGVDIKQLINLVSRKTKRNFIVDPRVKGTVNIVTGRDLTDDELYETFLSVLRVHGFVVIKQGSISKIVPKNIATQETAPISTAQGFSYGEERVTRLVPVQHVNVLSITTALRPIARGVQIQHHTQSNTVVMSGRASDLDRLEEMIHLMDKADEKQIEVIPIQYADAKNVVKSILALNPPTAKGQKVSQATKVSSDERTNSVLITGDKATRGIIRRIIARLDVPQASKSKILILPLHYANAEEVVKTIQNLDKGTSIIGKDGRKIAVGGATKVSADKRTNSIIISGDDSARNRIAEMVKTLDLRKENNNQIIVIELRYADAEKIVQTIKELDQGETIIGANGKAQSIRSSVQVSSNQRTNSIIISGEQEPRERIARMVEMLDIKKQNNNKILVIELLYADAKKMVETIKDLNPGNVVKDANGKVLNVGNDTKVSANERTNSILISGDNEARVLLGRMVQALDVPKEREGNTKVIYLRYAKADNLAKVLQGISKTGQIANAKGKSQAANNAGGDETRIDIQADESSNSLIITAERDVLETLEGVIEQLDIRRAQVMVETIVAEVSSNLSNALGIQFGFNANGGQGPALATNYAGAGGNNLNNIASAIAAGGGALSPGLLLGLGAQAAGNQFVALLNTLATDAATNILSTPTLVTMDNEEAEIVVGQNIPLVTGSYASTGSGASSPFQTIERSDVGLTLKITPQINEGTSVRLDIQQEVSSVAASVAGAADLITNKRSIKTTVMVDDGEILVLGGLLENTFRDTEEKVPVLGNLPVIGKFFRHTASQKDKKYLMVFIHPMIIRDNIDANYYTQAKYSAMLEGEHDSNILERGRFNLHAESFPSLHEEQEQATPTIYQRTSKREPYGELEKHRMLQQQRNAYKRKEQEQRRQNELARQRAHQAEQARRQALQRRRQEAAARQAR